MNEKILYTYFYQTGLSRSIGLVLEGTSKGKYWIVIPLIDWDIVVSIY